MTEHTGNRFDTQGSADREEIFMQNSAPFPVALEELVTATRYKPAWTFRLVPELDRGQGSQGMTLVIMITTPDSYHPETNRTVQHFFPVPPAAYDMRSWRRWLFDQVLLVERHEAMEFFALQDDSLLDASLASCEKCAHTMTLHDGRDSSCAGPGCESHRFSVDPHDAVYARPYAPSHGFGQDPYLIRELGTKQDQRTSFRNEVRP